MKAYMKLEVIHDPDYIFVCRKVLQGLGLRIAKIRCWNLYIQHTSAMKLQGFNLQTPL